MSDSSASNDAAAFFPDSGDYKPMVLVVDDNEPNRELLLAYLDDLPVRTAIACDGLEAMAQVEQVNPDVVLLDVMMPKMSGFEVCRKLKSDPSTADIPVIMVTALNQISDIERAHESGTNEFISKPVNKMELLKRVENLLHIRRLKQQLESTLRELQAINPQVT